MSLTTFLDAFANETLKVLGYVEPIAQSAEPFVAIAAPAIAPLYNLTVTLIKNVEAVKIASGTTNGTAAMALVVQDLEPIAVTYLQSLGISAPTTAQVQAYAQAIYESLVALSALGVTAAPTPAPAAPVTASSTTTVGNSEVTVTEQK